LEFAMKTMKAAAPAPKGRPARPPPVHAPTSTSPGWLGAGLFRIMILGAIVVGGIGVLLWLRDMGSASGINWLS
jgi:hypothetical protein